MRGAGPAHPLELRPEGLPGAMEPHPGVVRGDARLLGDLADRTLVEVHLAHELRASGFHPGQQVVQAGADGFAQLGVDAVLATVARWRSRDMVERGYFSHDIPDIGNVFRRLDVDGYCYELAGENIGWDVDTDTAAPVAIQAMFMDSPGHRRNVLDARWDVVGIGAFKAADGRKMFTVLFADRCGTTALADEGR